MIVVDDASRDDTARIAREAGATVVEREQPGGPVGGAQRGRGRRDVDLIAFTDADCEPAPGWLREGLEALRDADLVAGPIVPDPTARRGPFDRTVDVREHQGRFETANLFVRREAFERAGGFAPLTTIGLPPDQGHFGEDVVFGWRVVRAGGRAAYAQDAVVHHAVFPRDAPAYVAERWRMRFFPALVTEVPELREHMVARVFLSRRTAAFDLAAAGLALAVKTRKPWPLLAAIPYLHRHLHGTPRDKAVHVAADMVGLLSLVYGSARSGNPVA